MPQISLYVDKKTLDMVEKNARISHKSVSKWVCDQLKTSVKEAWPENYFKSFGALAESDFPEIKNLSFKNDLERESL